MRCVTIAMVLFVISGCNDITSPQNLGNAYKFGLQSVEKSTNPEKQHGSLIVDFPKVSAELDTYRISLLRNGGKQDYYSGVRWADFLPVIVQSAMVESLQNSGLFNVVAADYANISADYLLQSDIKAFHADYTKSNPPTIVIKIHLALVEVKTLKIIKTLTVIREETAKANDISSIYKSFNVAFISAQKEALEQIIKTD